MSYELVWGVIGVPPWLHASIIISLAPPFSVPEHPPTIPYSKESTTLLHLKQQLSKVPHSSILRKFRPELLRLLAALVVNGLSDSEQHSLCANQSCEYSIRPYLASGLC